LNGFSYQNPQKNLDFDSKRSLDRLVNKVFYFVIPIKIYAIFTGIPQEFMTT
jgi:hypothetical protein